MGNALLEVRNDKKTNVWQNRRSVKKKGKHL